jgi:myo-inositol-1(or 4)-monophosphatase
MNPEYSRVALEAAEEAVKIHLHYFTGGFSAESKNSQHHNMVTEADVEAEKAAVAVIRKYFPDHNLFGEEGKYPRTSSEFGWYIDPLDGTNNFFKGIPHFSASVGVYRGGAPVAAAVIDSTRNERFWAQSGEGAYLDDRRIRVSSHGTLENAMLYTGFYYDRGEHMRRTLDAIETFFGEGVMGIRRSGSAALDLCYLACGRCDGFWEHFLSPWDTAAARCIIEEAGGRISDENLNPLPLDRGSMVFASNGILHEEILRKGFGSYSGP